MFSGEAMNRSGEYLSRAVSGYLYGTGLALRMLIAAAARSGEAKAQAGFDPATQN